jgi:hypothetical protein
MLFPRLDVKECLIRGDGIRRNARQLEQLEIDLTGARSSSARELLERAQGQVARYMIDNARRLNCEASEVARQEKDGFVEAAATMLQTILMDGMSPGASQVHYLDQALQAMEFELFVCREQLLANRTPRAEALVIMTPRLALRDLIEENKGQFQLREDSLLLAETRLNIDRALANGEWVKAINVARIGSQNATEQFGADHWWNAIMMARLATALLRQQQPVGTVHTLVIRAGFILDEWTDFSAKSDVFAFEKDILRTAASDIKLLMT